MLLRATLVRPATPNAQGSRRLRRKDGGFTLLELLAVLVILAVIIAIAVPLIGNILERSKEDATISTAGQIAEAARLYVTTEANGDFTTKNSVDVNDLVTNNYITKPYDGWGNEITAGTVTFNSDGSLKEVTLTSDKIGTKTFTAADIRDKKWP